MVLGARWGMKGRSCCDVRLPCCSATAGTAFLVGGFKHSAQSFNKVQTHLGSGMLLMAAGCLILPTALVFSNADVEKGLLLSRILAIFMLLLYISFLVFQLKTHAHLFEDDDGEHDPEHDEFTGVVVSEDQSRRLLPAATAPTHKDAVSPAKAGKPPLAPQAGSAGLPSYGTSSPARRESSAAPRRDSFAPRRDSSARPERRESYAGRRESFAGGSVRTSRDGGGSTVDVVLPKLPIMHPVQGNDGDDEPALGLWTAIIWLIVIAGIIAALSEVLVSSSE